MLHSEDLATLSTNLRANQAFFPGKKGEIAEWNAKS